MQSSGVCWNLGVSIGSHVRGEHQSGSQNSPGKGPKPKPHTDTPCDCSVLRLGLCCFPLSRDEMYGWVSRIPEGGVSSIPEGDIFVFLQLFLWKRLVPLRKVATAIRG